MPAVFDTVGSLDPVPGRRLFSAGGPFLCFVPGGGSKNLGVA